MPDKKSKAMIETSPVLDKDSLLKEINENIDRPEFVYFLNSLLNKYHGVKNELEKIDYIIQVICERLNIPKDKFLSDIKYIKEKGLFLYIVNKEIGLSLREISEMFDVPLGTVHRLVDSSKFLVEKHKMKVYVSIIFVVKSELDNKPNAT